MGNVVFQNDDWSKLEEYVALCPVEIACMGYATLEGSDVMVKDVFLVPQDISLSSVEFLSKGLPYAVQKALKEDRIEELRFCWHSHATHSAFFSATDEDMVRKVRDSAPLPWFASTVLNKKGDTHAQLDYFKPEGELSNFTNHVTIELDVQIEGRLDHSAIRMAEIEQFCEKKKTKSYKGKKLGHETKTNRTKESAEKPPPLEQVTPQEIPDKVSGRDWKLHNEARTQGWDCYVDEESDLAYYWNRETGEFMGSALIPTDPKTGDWKIDINVTVIDGSAEDEGSTSTDLVPIDQAEDLMLQRAIERGML